MHTSATAGIYSLINQGKVFFQPQSLASLLILHFRDEQKCTGNADAQTDSMCPSEVGHNWRYNDGTSWPDAGEGLIVKCISETGRTQNKLQARLRPCFEVQLPCLLRYSLVPKNRINFSICREGIAKNIFPG